MSNIYEEHTNASLIELTKYMIRDVSKLILEYIDETYTLTSKIVKNNMHGATFIGSYIHQGKLMICVNLSFLGLVIYRVNDDESHSLAAEFDGIHIWSILKIENYICSFTPTHIIFINVDTMKLTKHMRMLSSCIKPMQNCAKHAVPRILFNANPCVYEALCVFGCSETIRIDHEPNLIHVVDDLLLIIDNLFIYTINLTTKQWIGCEIALHLNDIKSSDHVTIQNKKYIACYTGIGITIIDPRTLDMIRPAQDEPINCMHNLISYSHNGKPGNRIFLYKEISSIADMMYIIEISLEKVTILSATTNLGAVLRWHYPDVSNPVIMIYIDYRAREIEYRKPEIFS